MLLFSLPSRFAALVFLGAVLLWAGPAMGHGSATWAMVPEKDIAIGPGVAWVHGPGDGYAINYDISYSYVIFSASLNGKLVVDGDLVYGGPQAEVTMWYFANFGGGVGYMFGDLQGPIYHLFLGVPVGGDWVPDWMNPFETVFIEPYYRLNLFVPDHARLVHELGLMLKITTFDFHW